MTDRPVQELLNLPFFQVLEIQKMLREIEGEMAEEGVDLEKKMNQYSHLYDQFESMGGYEYIKLQEEFIQVFNLNNKLTRHYCGLSGGEKQYIRLALTVFSHSELIILDEPLTFLDAKKAKWLKNYLVDSSKTYLIVSHNSKFVDAFSTKIFDIDNGIIKVYQGSYLDYLEKKSQYEQREKQGNKTIDLIVEKKKETLEKKYEWIKKAENKHQHAVLIRRLERDIKKLQNQKTKFEARKEYDFRNNLESVTTNDFKKEIYLDIVDLKHEFGCRLLYKELHLKLYSTDRILISGENGSGKTTLLKIIEGSILPSKGEIFRNPNVRMKYISQEVIFNDENVTVLDYCKKITRVGDVILEDAIDSLYGDEEFRLKRLHMLSGGERKRLQIFSEILLGFDLLLIDEPTTYMDEHSKLKIVSLLNDFQGCIILVSHDEFFIKKLMLQEYVIQNSSLKKEG